jgi:hypothetical protein
VLEIAVEKLGRRRDHELQIKNLRRDGAVDERLKPEISSNGYR